MKEKDSMTAESRKSDIRVVPDPEVPEKAVRRKFTAAFKLRILKEAEACTRQGQLGALLRREGLYIFEPYTVETPDQSGPHSEEERTPSSKT